LVGFLTVYLTIFLIAGRSEQAQAALELGADRASVGWVVSWIQVYHCRDCYYALGEEGQSHRN